jgi:uncharacterized protein (TIGR03086 family)
MSDTTASRFRRITDTFTERVREVPEGAWDNPAPCDGWTARDVVRHLVEWVPYVIGRSGLEFPTDPTVDDDPYRAWCNLVDTLQAALDDPAVAARSFDAGPPGTMTVENAIGMLVTGDVLVHTWDLAIATGLDATLDPEAVADLLRDMEPIDDALRASGHYGPRVTVSDDADPQTKLIAFTGRNPVR